MKNTNFDVSSKETLAKLLATEDITIVRKNEKTASFNLKNRTLVLPMWKDMNADTTDHLTGHEVGHALYTPEEGWMTSIEGKTNGFKTYLNVVEDARIEKLVMRRYPGLRKSFIKSYVKMLDDGFFGKSRTTINAYGLIDRLNVYFKCGVSAGVTFSKEEEKWVEEIKNAETWDEVVDISERLYDKAKEEAENEEAETGDSDEFGSEDFDEDYGYGDPIDFDDEGEEGTSGYGDEESEEESEESGDNGNIADSKSEDEGSTPSSPANEEGDDDKEESSSESSTPNKEGGYDFNNIDPTAKTDKILSDNIVSEYIDGDTSEIKNLYLPTTSVKRFITPYKKVISDFSLTYAECEAEVENIMKDLMKKFRANNKPTINYLVKEFEMKKRATEYARTTVAKTGVIDPIKMNNYRYSDDIFKKISVVPEGKNHGLLMFVDFSGSMAADMSATIDQTLNLVLFCRQVNIAFRVYGFTNKRGMESVDELNKYHEDMKADSRERLVYADDLNIIELFHNKMSRTDFTKMCEILSYTGLFYSERYGSGRNAYERYSESKTGPKPNLPETLWLYGTPLQDTICGAIEIFHDFKDNNRLDIVNTVFLTDGDSNKMASYSFNPNLDKMTHYTYDIAGYGRKAYLIDPKTKKSYKVESRYDVTSTLLKMFRDNTKSNAIGYRIVPKNKKRARSELYGFINDWAAFDKMWTTMNKDKFIMIPNSGYTEFFAIQGGKNLETANTSIEVAEDAKKGAIRTAFKKANNNRKASRLMLSKFIDLVA